MKVIVGLSGGVDSAVAALLLKREGHEVSALFMKNWEDDDAEGRCTSRQDLIDAAAVADVLGIDIAVVNLAAQYRERVFAPFLADHRAGLTPNPDVRCNAEIKFQAFLEHALALGADCIATGHYARIRHGEQGLELLRGRDPAKDQSYFLCRLTQGQLARARFPLGELAKTEVRALARKAGLAVHDKKDSTGICFIGKRPFRAFLARYLPATPGPVKTLDGMVIGRHAGAIYYTLGQREGLGIGGVRGAAQQPWYVVAKDVASNTLFVAQGHDHPRLYARRLTARACHWIGAAPTVPFCCTAKTRYRQPDQACTLTALEGERCEVAFEAPQRALTPGQAVVFYAGEVCLGGAIIAATAP